MRAASSSLCAAALFLIGIGVTCAASNIDPAHRFAYSENLGWLNLSPSDPNASGVVVTDFALTGWMWSENAGWISLSCANRGTCGTASFGVTNDGQGHLGGFAWAENLGWINFQPLGAGVSIDVTNGRFAGRAWSENAGWVSFESSGPAPYSVVTTWRCSAGTPRPAEVTGLSVTKSGANTIASWSAVSGATGYDLARGDVAALRTSGGNFTTSTEACVARKQSATSATVGETVPAGGAHWLLARAANCAGNGTYDETTGGQSGTRDAAIAASSGNCP